MSSLKFIPVTITSMVVILFIATFQNVEAQRKKKKSNETVSQFDEKLFSHLKWRNIGPYRGGRVVAVAGVRNDELTYYMGSTGGGLWKTTDGGTSWKNISDKYFKTGSVGAIGICESDPNVIYVGMGEHPVRGVMTSHGDGVYKSTDAGKTWTHIGLENTRHVSDVIVHPANPDLVYVAAQGSAYGPSPDRGIFMSEDGGKTWNKTLFVNNLSGASGLTMDMTNPRILYAATWDHQRFPWTIRSGGKGSGIHKSTDAGRTWKKLEEGLPEEMGKIGLSVSRADPGRVYAIIEAKGKEGGVYRSDDGGEKWTQTNKDRVNIARAWYYIEIFADPQDAETVYVLNSPLMRSIDGGRTFQNVPVPHVDTHDHWINPDNNQIMINANDGGGTISFNGGKTWSTQQNQPTAQFYRVITDQQFPYRIYGGQQDNTSVSIVSRTNGSGITWKDWSASAGGESAFLAFNPKDPKIVYGTSIQGFIDRHDVVTHETKSINAYPEFPLGRVPKDMKYRYNWNNPLVASPHNPSVMYHGAQLVLRTEDGGNSWKEISPDLTRNDTTKHGPGGQPFTNEAAGGENYNTIMYITESQHEKRVIWVGSDDGLVHITKNGGDNWENVTPAGLRESIINCIEVSPHDPATAYIVAMRYKFDDLNPYIYKTSDYGNSWTKVINGIDAQSFVRAVREDPVAKGVLYAGTENGLYVSFNDGNQWNKLALNLPAVPINDITIYENDLIAATAGRGFWILDDLGSIQQSMGKVGDASVVLYKPQPTVRFEASVFAGIDVPNAGKNPDNGVILDYYLKEEYDTVEVKLEILDMEGNVIRSYTNQKDEDFKPFPGGPPALQVLPTKKGMNRFNWDLRKETLPGIPKEFIFGDYRGHLVGPGKYTAKLVIPDDSTLVSIEVIPDPRLDARSEQFEAQQKLLNDIDTKVKEIHDAINKVYNAKTQMEAWNKNLKEKTELDTIVSLGKTIIEGIDKWVNQLIEPQHETFQDVVNFRSQLSTEFMTLKGYIDSHDPVITEGARKRYADILKMWEGYKKEMEQIIDEDLGRFNRLHKEKNVPAVIVD
ncbi:glycosyl hydrolase [Fulvivirgaceae bacterium BMA10]|uniref:Glycosyl hydrolase n=1 Tax=Splendidivirga corallicola TaxID=3051826 RepID=A0ABT8KV75_9BACT|nr:glycosyl hydrolase [Fulvivirgaceae bacterium BMA10]